MLHQDLLSYHTKPILLYTRIINMLIYTYACSCSITTTQWIIKQTHHDKVARTNDARKEDAGKLLYEIFYLSSLFVSFERVVQSLLVRASWRPNITEIFGPRSYGIHRCVFLVLYGCSTKHWESTLRGAGFSYYYASMSVSNYTACPPLYSPVCLLARWTQLTGTQLSSIQLVGLILPSNSHAVMWTRLCNFFRYLAIGMCHFHFLWNGLCDRHRAEITVIQFRGHSLPVRQSMRV